MSTERCEYCGRILKYRLDCIYNKDCSYCRNGNLILEIAHAKSVRLAWKYRAITRRKCKDCKTYDNDCYNYVAEDAQCPRWVKK